MGRLTDALIGILSSRTLLGLCALVLAGCAVVWALQSDEQKCRDRIDAELEIEVARAVQRIEGYQLLRDSSDFREATVLIDQSQDALDAYERAITRRENAVSICGGG